MRSDEGGLLLDNESILSGAGPVAARARDHTNRAPQVPRGDARCRGALRVDVCASTAQNGIGSRLTGGKIAAESPLAVCRRKRSERRRFAPD